MEDDQKALENYVKGGIDEVEGWFYGGDVMLFQMLASLQQKLGVGGDVCELGVYKGKSLILLSFLRSLEQKLFAFDLFPSDLLDQIQRNMQKHCTSNRLQSIEYVVGKSTAHSSKSLSHYFEKKVRFLHIDAGHEYHEILQSMYAFAPHLSDWAIIAMDDYQDREFPGVEAAVHSFSQSRDPRRFVPFVSGQNKIYLCNEKLATVYQKKLLEIAQLREKCRVSYVEDYFILIAFSRLPIDAEKINLILDGVGGDFTYPVDEDYLIKKANIFGQFSRLYNDEEPS